MAFFVITVLLAIGVTALGSWIVVRRWPGGGYVGQSLLASASFPIVAFLLFVLATAWTLLQPTPAGSTGNEAGMVVFAFVFFLFYALAVGVALGVPTAFVAVKTMRPKSG